MAAPTEYSFSTYTYSGPIQSVSLRAKNPDGEPVTYFEAVLHPGKDYLLPDDHSAVRGWKAMKLIKPAQSGEEGA
ncbi:hypothetical protein J7481_19540 [Labrenzia sp. R4_2]|uniref:hypothetical protein n=1 Tax=Labrenzia sp. R4_2 TaxID=2821107 RepID=UPI001AD9A1CF|nr:hypothetical protein [Labrenzia sp. R4_2]MBO9421710.1 hypothetical protein [Labrenzia sp. R4_2]